MNKYNVGSISSGFKKEKRALSDAQLRLAVAFVVLAVTITLFVFVGIQFASASGAFGPLH